MFKRILFKKDIKVGDIVRVRYSCDWPKFELIFFAIVISIDIHENVTYVYRIEEKLYDSFTLDTEYKYYSFEVAS